MEWKTYRFSFAFKIGWKEEQNFEQSVFFGKKICTVSNFYYLCNRLRKQYIYKLIFLSS